MIDPTTENRKQWARRTFSAEISGSVGEKSAKVGSVAEGIVSERVSENLSSRSKVELKESEKKEEREEEREPWS